MSQVDSETHKAFLPVLPEVEGEVDFTMDPLVPFDSGWVWFQLWFLDML